MQDIQQLEHYLGRREVPADFDEFWERNLQKLPASFQANLIYSADGANSSSTTFTNC